VRHSGGIETASPSLDDPSSCGGTDQLTTASEDTPLVFRDENEAHAEANRRNRALGEQRVQDRFWLEKQHPDGEWVIELRTEESPKRRSNWLTMLLDFLNPLP
jgi:hypothetical protein